jgi:hypothetical protein
MIRLRTALRVMPAVWLALPLVAFACWYVTLLYASDGYAVDATSQASMTIAFVGAVLAACAAWEGTRLRRGGIWSAPSVRSRWVVAFWALLPVVLVGLVAVTAAMVVNLARSDAGLVPDWRFVVMTAIDLVAYASAGFAAGLLLPIAVAGPLAIVAVFFWIGFVPAMDPVWLRHLTGMFRDCCTQSQDLAWPPVIASFIVDAGIVAAAALLITGPGRLWGRAAGAAASFAGAFVIGSLLVANMTYAPAVARDTATLDCRTDAGITVCVWPEQQRRAADVAGIVAEVRTAWQQAGMQVPTVFTEADPSVAPADAVDFNFDAHSFSRDNIISSLAAGMLPSQPDCGFGGSTGGVAFEYLQAWYEAVGGVSPDAWNRAWANAFGEPDYPAVTDIVAELKAASPQARRQWVSRVEGATRQCDTWDPSLIAVQP